MFHILRSFFINYKGIFLNFLLFLFLVTADQISKSKAVLFFHNICSEISGCSYEVMSFFNLSFVCNNGISFGMLANIPYPEMILSTVSIFVIVIFLRIFVKSNSNLEKLAITLIVSGAVGNLIDRLKDKCVTDFLHFFWKDYHFPVFNVADIFVTIGGFLIVLIEFQKVFLAKKSNK